MSLKEIMGILKMSDLFCELSEKELQSIAELCRIEEFEAGDIIYQQGSIGTKLYILDRGYVTLEREIDLGGTRKAKLNVFSLMEKASRRVMGSWYTLIGQQHVHMCSAICEKPTKIVSMQCSDLRNALIQNSTIRIKILEQLVLLLRDRIISSYEAVETL